MNVDLERVKKMTLEKIENNKKTSFIKLRKVLLVAAVVVTLSALFLGAAKLFDWRVMVNGEIQQGYYGDTIIVGDGFASMTPERNDNAHEAATETHFPDSEPFRIAKAGELSLFSYKSEDSGVISGGYGVSGDESTSLGHIRPLAENAEAKIHWPSIITDDYKVLNSLTGFYTKKEQIAKAKLLYNNSNAFKSQQLFSLPQGYERFIEQMHIEFEMPDGKAFVFFSRIGATDSQVYGSSGNSIIEQIDVAGFKSVVFVSDNGWNQIYAWRKIPKIKSIDALAFGENERPADSLLNIFHREDTIYQWQQYAFDSYSLSKDELLKLLYSIDLTE